MKQYNFHVAGERLGPPPTTLQDFFTHIWALFLEELAKRSYTLVSSNITVERFVESGPAHFKATGTAKRATPVNQPDLPENILNKLRNDLTAAGWAMANMHVNETDA